MSDACKSDVRNFFIARAEDVRKDFELLSICSVEIKTLCGKVLPGDGRVLACLKQSKQALSEKCSKAVTLRQVLLTLLPLLVSMPHVLVGAGVSNEGVVPTAPLPLRRKMLSSEADGC